jgi:hypothetical protein
MQQLQRSISAATFYSAAAASSAAAIANACLSELAGGESSRCLVGVGLCSDAGVIGQASWRKDERSREGQKLRGHCDKIAQLKKKIHERKVRRFTLSTVTRRETYLVFGLFSGELNEARRQRRRPCRQQCRCERHVEMRGRSIVATRQNGRGMRKAERQQSKEKDESSTTHGGMIGRARLFFDTERMWWFESMSGASSNPALPWQPCSPGFQRIHRSRKFFGTFFDHRPPAGRPSPAGPPHCRASVNRVLCACVRAPACNCQWRGKFEFATRSQSIAKELLFMYLHKRSANAPNAAPLLHAVITGLLRLNSVC